MAKSSPIVDWRWAVNTTNRLPWQAKAVGQCLGASMTKDGWCDKVSQALIAERLDIGITSVKTGVRILKQRGWLFVGKRRIREGATGKLNTYQACFPIWHSKSAEYVVTDYGLSRLDQSHGRQATRD